MRKVLLISAVLAIPVSMYALELEAAEGEGLSIGLSFSVHWAVMNSLVYDNSNVPDENNNNLISLLYWDIKPAYMIGVEGQWNNGNLAYMDFALRTAFSGGKVGFMNDFDWEFSDKPWSHWSLSELTLRWGFTADVFQSWKIVEVGVFSMGLGAGYHLDWWAWSDILLDSIYSDSVEKDGRKVPFPYAALGSEYHFRRIRGGNYIGQNVIDYAVSHHVLAASLDLNVKLGLFHLRLLGRIGPVFAHGEDNHKAKGVLYNDVVFGGPWIESHIEASFLFSRYLSFSVRGEYAWMNETVGIQYLKKSSTGSESAAYNGAGIAMYRISVTAVLKWRM